jgi:ADP-ribose pyrophosphatase YjhB (NUDIX family)
MNLESSRGALMPEMTSLQKLLRQGQRLLGLLMRPMTLGVRVIALDAGGRVFLVRHTYLPGFYLPGGGVERNETALASLERELEEEGRIALAEPPRLIGFFYNPRHSRRDHVALYLAKNVRQTAARKPDWEIIECGFYPLDGLPAATSPSTRARLDEFINGATPDSIW